MSRIHLKNSTLAGKGVRPTRQHRSRKTRDAILNASASLLDEGRLASATVAQIVERAGCSVGAFYGRFADKAAAIAALYQARREEFIERLNAHGASSEDLDTWARGAAEIALDHAIANRALLVLAATDLAGARDAVFEEARAANIAMVDEIKRLITEKFALRLTPEEAASASAFVLATLGAQTRDAAVFSAGLLGPERIRSWFLDQLARAVSAYLRDAAGTT